MSTTSWLSTARRGFIEAATPTSVLAEYLGAQSQYPLLVGLQPDLYRAFMARTWVNASPDGVIAMIHPESHFTEKKALHLRAEAHRRLRRHWQFRNAMLLFEVHDGVFYGIHVYGHRQESPSFLMAASLYHPDTVERSLRHEGGNEVPGLKNSEGKWDTRPHPERIVNVDNEVLQVWADILDEPGTPPLHARMVYPVNRASMRVLEKLSKAPRVRELGLKYSSGWHETADRKAGYFEVGSAVNDSWDDVILQGPHFTVANPFAKQPNPSMRNNLDWTELDLEALPEDFIPRTSYQPVRDGSVNYDADYTKWEFGGRTIDARSVYRLGWRRMASVTGMRTLFPTLLPPGAAHVDNVYSAFASDSVEELMALGGVMSSLPVDFLVKVSGASKINGDSVERFPLPEGTEVRRALATRFARLTCMTGAWAHIWQEVSGSKWLPDRVIRLASSRRRIQVELDALAAISLDLSADELCIIYRTQFPVLRGYEQSDLYDTNGRKVPAEMNKIYRKVGQEGMLSDDLLWTHPQSQVEYAYEFPFRGYDREDDMRAAYAEFEAMLNEHGEIVEGAG